MRKPSLIALQLVEAELVERLAHVEIGLAGGDDADLRAAAAGGDDLVELVGAHEGEHGVALEVVQPRFLAEKRVLKADVEAAVGHDEIGRRDDLDAIERSRRRRRSNSTVSCMHLSAAQAPVKRDIAQP